jgi:hypothetical protein
VPLACARRTLTGDLGPGVLPVELRRFELLTPCLQIAVSTCGQAADLAIGSTVSDRSVPLVTGVSGTLMARRSWSRCGIPSVLPGGRELYLIAAGLWAHFRSPLTLLLSVRPGRACL